ncbi:threonine synthase [Pseudonocardia sp. MH-G8]|uniref:threonine synthase n=1 Tax=Pseudonocardia sp. MH-G8 TaxID=1854588 RepID=UPI000BA0B117|nr:threonine synthase [Pseudonocardia sp. MH-G8]OZM76511.1 threonine synthase [Pseudonocardia sp. MH-G8]
MSAREWTPVCRACGARNPGTWSRCPGCGGVQVLEGPRTVPTPSGAGGLWRFRDALPPVRHEITMGEGGTPLVRCERLAARAEVAQVLVKNETVNPTLSFKDRAMALGVSLARAADAPGVVAASTGNTAVSAAAYAARAGLSCRLYCAADAAGSAKLRTARAYGAGVEPVDGDFSSAHAAAAELEADGWFPLTTTFRNPYLVEAHRTVALELFEQTDGFVPDWVLVPVGAGPLLVGAYEGFRALADAGRIPRVPRMVAVQVDACAPLVDAWRTNATTVTAANPRPTVAGAIADPLRGYEDEGVLTLEAVRESDGLAVSVPDEAVLEAVDDLARHEGLLVEPAGAAPLAALAALAADGTVAPDARVVLVATGHGAKE